MAKPQFEEFSQPKRPATLRMDQSGKDSISFDDDETPYYGHGMLARPHQIELEIRKLLLSIDGVSFASLQVRHVGDGICISGRIQSETEVDMKLIEEAARLAGANKIYNRLVTMHSQSIVRTCTDPDKSGSDLSHG